MTLETSILQLCHLDFKQKSQQHNMDKLPFLGELSLPSWDRFFGPCRVDGQNLDAHPQSQGFTNWREWLPHDLPKNHGYFDPFFVGGSMF